MVEDPITKISPEFLGAPGYDFGTLDPNRYYLILGDLHFDIHDEGAAKFLKSLPTMLGPTTRVFLNGDTVDIYGEKYDNLAETPVLQALAELAADKRGCFTVLGGNHDPQELLKKYLMFFNPQANVYHYATGRFSNGGRVIITHGDKWSPSALTSSPEFRLHHAERGHKIDNSLVDPFKASLLTLVPAFFQGLWYGLNTPHDTTWLLGHSHWRRDLQMPGNRRIIVGGCGSHQNFSHEKDASFLMDLIYGGAGRFFNQVWKYDPRDRRFMPFIDKREALQYVDV